MSKDARAERGVRHVHTIKPFFGQYTHKVTIPFPLKVQNIKLKYKKVNTLEGNRRIAKQIRKAKAAFIDSVMETLSFIEEDYTFRSGETSISFYTCNPEVASKIETSGLPISCVAAPKSEEAARFMGLHPDLLVRDSLFFDKYRYCVVLRVTYHTRPALRAYLATFEIEEKNLNFGRRSYHEFSKKKTTDFLFNGNDRLYFADETDITLARITIPECIERVEEVVLIKDIENAGSIAA